MTFTPDQIANWEAYERVRKSGVVNMFDVGTATKLSGLFRDEYLFCMKNYSQLKHQAERRCEESPK